MKYQFAKYRHKQEKITMLNIKNVLHNMAKSESANSDQEFVKNKTRKINGRIQRTKKKRPKKKQKNVSINHQLKKLCRKNKIWRHKAMHYNLSFTELSERFHTNI